MKIERNSYLSKQDILNVYSEEALFRMFCPGFKKLNTSFHSEFREDQNPSCRITMHRGRLWYKDFGSSDSATDIWGYLMKKFHMSFKEVLDMLGEMMRIEPSSDTDYSKLKLVQTSESGMSKHPHVIRIRKRNWEKRDANFWKRYELSSTILEEFCVDPISHYWIDSLMFTPRDIAYCYTYYYDGDFLLRKIYQPNEDRRTGKWFSNINRTVVQGIANIPKKADLLIVTSSLKDVMVLHNMGYPAVAPNNETTWIPESVWEKFKTRYKRILIMFDTDFTGFDSSDTFCEKYGISRIILPYEHFSEPGKKDISDLVELKGTSAAKNILEKEINMIIGRDSSKVFIIEYEVIRNNRLTKKITKMNAETAEKAEQGLRGLFEHFGINIVSCKVIEPLTNNKLNETSNSCVCENREKADT